MAYTSKYTGQKIDEAVGKALGFDVDGDGVVDKAKEAEKAKDSEKFGGETPEHYAAAEEVGKKENKGTTSTVVLASASWIDGAYSFESTYPSAEYDIYMELSEASTAEQIEAYASALIVGNSTTNVYTAKGGAPTIDIPVMLKVVKK